MITKQSEPEVLLVRLKAEIDGVKEIRFAKNKNFPLKSTHWIVNFSGSTP